MEIMEKKYYFTFGVSHILCNFMIEIVGTGIDAHECYNEARRIMMNSFGTYWCEQYTKEEALSIVNKYDYHIMRLNDNYEFDGDIYE